MDVNEIYPFPPQVDVEVYKKRQEPLRTQRNKVFEMIKKKQDARREFERNVFKYCAPRREKGSEPGPKIPTLQHYENLKARFEELKTLTEQSRVASERSDSKTKRVRAGFISKNRQDNIKRRERLEKERMVGSLSLEQERHIVSQIKTLKAEFARFDEIESISEEGKDVFRRYNDDKRELKNAEDNLRKAEGDVAKIQKINVEIDALRKQMKKLKADEDKIWAEFLAAKEEREKKRLEILEKRREFNRAQREKEKIGKFNEFLDFLETSRREKRPANFYKVTSLEDIIKKLEGARFEVSLKAAESVKAKEVDAPAEDISEFKIIRSKRDRMRGRNTRGARKGRGRRVVMPDQTAGVVPFEEKVEKAQPSAFLDSEDTAELKTIKVAPPSDISEIDATVAAIRAGIEKLKAADEKDLTEKLAEIAKFRDEVSRAIFSDELHDVLRKYREFRQKIYPPRKDGDKPPRKDGDRPPRKDGDKPRAKAQGKPEGKN
eukprot:gnl/Chilomastix_cuspidata/21.p1 GENE.gnl/Chilomastix_cuspidata/21~~gnl/Chilomastix_cuspidata/21.p1  ORF type:complete len:491 (-),score=250.10 gnl/Chilomastix_cuspidata/21:35-1507(-)